MKEIVLTQGKVALVDDEDFEELNQQRWAAHKERNAWYAIGHEKVGFRNYKKTKMHRIIMNAPDGVQIDHVDHNGLNNQKVNLRLCSNQENARNSKKRKGCSSRFKGVCYHKQNSNWRAYIQVGQERINIGSFSSELAAADAYNQRATELFGDFVRVNEI